MYNDRDYVCSSYKTAELLNKKMFLKGDVNATDQYTYPNQKEDAMNIISIFHTNVECRVVSVQKKTKVGADGLMIELATLMSTHPDDGFVIPSDNVRIITGMSNMSWERQLKEKVPGCFKHHIFHHGQLKKNNMNDIRDALIIIDEIDTGDGEFQKLQSSLIEHNLLNIHEMKKRNIRYVFISATMIRELYDLQPWGASHELYTMTIPETYIGHGEMLDRGLIQEHFPLHSKEEAQRWIREDVLEFYKEDYRIHFVRVIDTKRHNTLLNVQKACLEENVICKIHTSEDRLDQYELFNSNLEHHVVVCIKGFYRRAELIPNQWKLRIGATHELCSKTTDFNVQIQGLTGRMTGYWKTIIDEGHKTGPHRTSIDAIKNYEKAYVNPYVSGFTYKTRGFCKAETGHMRSKSTMLTTKQTKQKDSLSMTRQTVPYVFCVSQEEYATIKKFPGKKKWDHDTIFKIISMYNQELVHELHRLKLNGCADQVVEPKQAKTYDEYIVKAVEAHKSNRGFYRTGNKRGEAYSDKERYQFYLDNKEHRIIVCIYKGLDGVQPNP